MGNSSSCSLNGLLSHSKLKPAFVGVCKSLHDLLPLLQLPGRLYLCHFPHGQSAPASLASWLFKVIRCTHHLFLKESSLGLHGPFFPILHSHAAFPGTSWTPSSTLSVSIEPSPSVLVVFLLLQETPKMIKTTYKRRHLAVGARTFNHSPQEEEAPMKRIAYNVDKNNTVEIKFI